MEIWQKLEQRFRWLAQRGKFPVVVVFVVDSKGDGVIVDVVTSELY